MALWRTRRVGASASIILLQAETRVKQAVWSILLSTVLSLSKEKMAAEHSEFFWNFGFRITGIAMARVE